MSAVPSTPGGSLSPTAPPSPDLMRLPPTLPPPTTAGESDHCGDPLLSRRSTATASTLRTSSSYATMDFLDTPTTRRRRRRGSRRPSKSKLKSTKSFSSASSSLSLTRHPVSEETKVWAASGKVDAFGSHNWDRRRIMEQADVVAEIGRAVLAGGQPARYAWYKFDRMNAKARKRDLTEPGPGHYMSSRDTSGMGKQAMAGRRTAARATMAPRAKKGAVFLQPSSTPGMYRLKNRPSKLTGKSKRVDHRELSAAPKALGALANSKYRSGPSFSMSYRPTPKPPPEDLDTNNPPVLSSIGGQVLSTRATSGSAAFARSTRIKEPELTFAPNPHSYKPHHDFLKTNNPRAVMSGFFDSERNPLPYDAAVGTYDLGSSMGRQPADHRKTAPTVRFAVQDRAPDMRLDKFELAQDRKQPQPLRRPVLPRHRGRFDPDKTAFVKFD